MQIFKRPLCPPQSLHPLSELLKKQVTPAPFSETPNAGNPLWDIFANNTDKSIHKWHHYFNIYHKHFQKYIGKKVNILEIGVNFGGSLPMWQKYFGKDANIFGIDIDPRCKQYEREGLKIFIGDQSDRNFMREVMAQIPKIDILIDDGGHTTRQQINSFLECYDKIADDGVYLVEDLHTNYWPNYIDSEETFMEFAKKHIDYLNAWFFCGEYETFGRYFSIHGAAAGDPGIEQVPAFTAITHSVTFYNSVCVFEKTPIMAPYSERR